MEQKWMYYLTYPLLFCIKWKTVQLNITFVSTWKSHEYPIEINILRNIMKLHYTFRNKHGIKQIATLCTVIRLIFGPLSFGSYPYCSWQVLCRSGIFRVSPRPRSIDWCISFLGLSLSGSVKVALSRELSCLTVYVLLSSRLLFSHSWQNVFSIEMHTYSYITPA